MLMNGIVLIAISGFHLDRGTEFPYVRHSTLGYTTACGVGCVLISVGGHAAPVYWLGAFGGALALYVDWKNCNDVGGTIPRLPRRFGGQERTLTW